MPTKEKNTVKRMVDVSKPPRITQAQKARLAVLADMPDAAIDYSDAPHQPDAAWMKSADLPQNKKQITLRIDADVLEFFRATGERYQSRINAVLRSYVLAHKTDGH